MGKLKFLLLLNFVFSLNIIHAQTWTAKANYGSTGRNRATGFSVPSLGKAYVVGGYDGAYEQDVWEYDTTTNVWTQKANFPGAPTVAVAFNIGDKGYVGTGVGGGYSWTDSFYEYDPINNTWTPKANFPGGPRGYCVGFAIGGKGYLGGGFTGTAGTFISFNDFYQYDPVNDLWTSIASYPGQGAALGASGFSIGGKGYAGCGSSIDVQGNQTLHNDFWEYDPNNNNWSQKADYAGGVRGEATSFSICDRGYLGLGYNVPHVSFTNDFWEYDAVADVWISIPDYGGSPRAYAPGFSIGKSGYAGTGSDGVIEYNDFWEFHKTYTANFSGVPYILCQGSQVIFTNQSSFNATGWSWSFPGGTPVSSNVQDPVVTYNSPGTFDVTLVAYNNCDSDTVTQISYINVIPLPIQPDLGNDTIFCGSFQVQLNAGSTGFNYLWSTGDTTPIIQVSTPGTFFVSVGNSCGTVSDTVIIQQESLPEVSAGNDVSVCDIIGYPLNATGNPNNYLWSTGDTTSTVLIYASGTYWVTVSNFCGVASDSVNVLLLQSPSIDIGKDTTICNFTALILDGGSSTGIFLWSTGSMDSSITVIAPGLYWVTVSNECGMVTDSILISACEIDYLVPGAFTPNEDGVNDVLSLIRIGDVTLIDFSIFSRWGQKVFSTINENVSWNGSYKNMVQPVGVYVYTLRYYSSGSGKEMLKSGNITLIR